MTAPESNNGPRPPAAPGPAADATGFGEVALAEAGLLTDRKGGVVRATAAATAVLQCAEGFLVGKPLGMFVAAADRPQFYRFLLGIRGGRALPALEVRAAPPGREARNVLLSVADDEQSGLTRWTLIDVTTVRLAEQALQAERELLGGVVDAADAIILVVSSTGLVIRSNAYLGDMTGYDGVDLAGREWTGAVIAPADQLAARRVLAQAVAHGTSRSGPLAVRTRGGVERAVAWSARRLPRWPGPQVALVGHDVTELQEAQARALEAGRLAAIGEVVAGLAHESRNALQRSQACLSLLALRLADRPADLDLVTRTQRAQDDLSRLYEGVLHYARPVHLTRAPCDLPVVWREAWADLGAAGDWSAAELAEEMADGNAVVAGDPFHLKRVFRNLFENARAAVPGPVRVTVRCEPTRLDDRLAVRVRVRDNGPGFPAATRDRLFTAFFTTKTHGTGLGLALCKRVVEEHGGRIAAGTGSEPGAEIILTLPKDSP